VKEYAFERVNQEEIRRVSSGKNGWKGGNRKGGSTPIRSTGRRFEKKKGRRRGIKEKRRGYLEDKPVLVWEKKRKLGRLVLKKREGSSIEGGRPKSLLKGRRCRKGPYIPKTRQSLYP